MNKRRGARIVFAFLSAATGIASLVAWFEHHGRWSIALGVVSIAAGAAEMGLRRR